MQLGGAAAAGAPDVMLTCLVEEFARMGMTAAEIEALFERPFFRATYGLGQIFGSDALRRRIREVVRRSGIMKFRVCEAARPARPPGRVRTPPLSGGEGRS